MLAKLSRELPTKGFVYEPKWDGFRTLAFRDGSEVDLRSRSDKKLSRYFPEIVELVVSTPLTWQEVETGVGARDPAAFVVSTADALGRVETRGDPFAPLAFA